MSNSTLTERPEWQRLQEHAGTMADQRMHLRHLLEDPHRLPSFSLSGGGLFFDFSRQRVNRQTMALLYELAANAGIHDRFRQMMAGARLNVTEQRAALHTATRHLDETPVYVDGEDVMPAIRSVRDAIDRFAGRVHAGELRGSTGRRFRQMGIEGHGPR